MIVPDISIIIVNWNSKRFVDACLRSIYANTPRSTQEILVIDNASFDGCEEMIQANYPDVTYMQCSHNIGFAGANNVAFTRSTGRTVLFLNPDTEICGPAIQRLVDALDEREDVGMVGAHLLNADLSLQTTCVTATPRVLNQVLNLEFLRASFPTWSLWGMRALYADSSKPLQVEAISGACMLAKRHVMMDVNVFSTDYFMYAEDMDLCIKVTRAGWKICYVPNATIIHHAGGSSLLRSENHFSNIMLRISLIRFFELHRGKTYARMYRVTLILSSCLRLLLLFILSPLGVAFHRRAFLQAVSKWSYIFAWAIGASIWNVQQPTPEAA